MRKYALALLLCCISESAHAEEKLVWREHWPKVSPVEYALTGASILGAAGIFLFVDPPSDGYDRGLLFDEPVRDGLRAGGRSGRDRARLIGDLGYRTLLVYPFADAVITPWIVHGNPEVSWQVFSISAEAIALAGFAGIATDHLIGRARPSRAECQGEPEYERFCGEEDEFSSFISGHTAIASAGAAVTCAHHLNLPLYGGGAADVVTCVGASALAVTSGVARIVNDRHWATDVVFAWMVGGVSGFVLPSVLHYRAPRSPHASATESQSARRLLLFPVVSPHEIGIGLLVR
jgi:membrane-associated phospholipid phosphatase